MKKNRCPIRVGSIVEVGEGVHAIKRIGYPMHFREIEFEDMEDGHPFRVFAERYVRGYDPDGLGDALKKAYVREKGFGGRERQVIRYPDDILEPGRYEVCEVHIKHIGTYCPGYQLYSAWDLGEWEPAYLENRKTIKVLSVVGEGIFDIGIQILSTDCHFVENPSPVTKE